jgi:hypothetical protein
MNLVSLIVLSLLAQAAGPTTAKPEAKAKAQPCTFKYQYDPTTNPTGGRTDCQKMEELGYNGGVARVEWFGHRAMRAGAAPVSRFMAPTDTSDKGP